MQITKLLLLSIVFSTNLVAQEIKVIGTTEHAFKTPQSKNLNAQQSQKTIKLLKMKLSGKALDVLDNRAAATLKKSDTLAASSLPAQVSLGMNNVPVLDQGPFGTCVTFATTAAVDAAMNKGDYISQLCQLQLGLHFEKHGYQPSGWDGSLGRYALSQMESFGIISKEKQQMMGCGGLTQYPDSEQPLPDSAMSLKQFHFLSEDINLTGVVWSPVLDLFQAVLERTDTGKTLNEIKNSLNQGDRVTFAVLLLDFDLGFAGAVGTHNATFDSWVLTPEIARDIHLRPDFGGHEMIITGYDDEAVAIDDQGREHKGLLTLRNSWGDSIGDKGDFYMSYDYFKVLVVEAQRIRTLAGNIEPAAVSNNL